MQRHLLICEYRGTKVDPRAIEYSYLLIEIQILDINF